MLQKRYVVKIIEADDNNCLVTALAIGNERSLEVAHGAKKMKNKFRRYKTSYLPKNYKKSINRQFYTEVWSKG